MGIRQTTRTTNATTGKQDLETTTAHVAQPAKRNGFRLRLRFICPGMNELFKDEDEDDDDDEDGGGSKRFVVDDDDDDDDVGDDDDDEYWEWGDVGEAVVGLLLAAITNQSHVIINHSWKSIISDNQP